MNKLLLVLFVLVVAGCATRETLLNYPSTHSFDSSKSAGSLAVCIDRNVDSSMLYNLRSKITNVEGEPVEVLMRRGDTVAVIAQIKPTTSGSQAKFFFGASEFASYDGSLDFLTKDCQ
jgi:hypothetical protein